MKIGIIVHSSTGTTKEFSNIIAHELKQNGHHVDQVLLETDVPITSGTIRKCKKFAISNMPDGSSYDIILVGGPVWAFSASPIIIDCIKRMKGLSQKKVIPFVTMFFPLKTMGGTSAVALMKKTARDAGAEVLSGVIVPKAFHNFKKDMRTQAAAIAARLKKKK